MDRRRALVVFINTVGGLIGAGLSAVLGAFALRPAAPREADWVGAGSLDDLTPNVPVARVVARAAQDGWYRQRSRSTVFVVWDGKEGVHALSGTCTHLGCQLNWNSAERSWDCPCHGSRFTPEGEILQGPAVQRLPRKPLA